jgi:hypothetical protein
MYAECTIDADDNEAARKRAIDQFKTHAPELQWVDANYDNLALPSIVNIQCDDPPSDVLEGYDFAITAEDARQYAAHKLLNALLSLLPDIESEIDQRKCSADDKDWIELDRRAADARAAIAEAPQV